MRAIGYFRIKDDRSVAEMEEAFREYCELNMNQPLRVFGERESQEGRNSDEYRGMLEFLRDSGSEFLVVVPGADHLGYDLESAARSIVELEEAGAKVTCQDEDLPDPLQNALLTFGAKGVSRTRSARIREAMRARAIKGLGLGKPPYGYRNAEDGTLEVVRDEAAVVELVYRLYTKDELGLRLIVQHLNERGIRTRRGGNWNMVTIRDILRNPTYIGTSTRFGLRVPKSHEPIIPADVFRKAQGRSRKRRPVGQVAISEPFLLSGLAYCGYCDNKMMGVTRRQSWRRKDGRRSNGVYRYYQCQSKNNQSVCGYHTWRAPLLENTVLAQLKYALRQGPRQRDSIEPDALKETARSAREARLRNAERRFLRAMRRAARAELSVRKLGQYLAGLDVARRGVGNAQPEVAATETLATWDSLAFEERQAFLAEQVARIQVKDDAVELAI